MRQVVTKIFSVQTMLGGTNGRGRWRQRVAGERSIPARRSHRIFNLRSRSTVKHSISRKISREGRRSMRPPQIALISWCRSPPLVGVLWADRPRLRDDGEIFLCKGRRGRGAKKCAYKTHTRGNTLPTYCMCTTPSHLGYNSQHSTRRATT